MIEVAHDTDRVAAIARPFVASKLESHRITFPAWWRIAEHLMVGLERMNTSRYEKLTVRPVVELVTKIALNTVADQPWAHQDYTHPVLMQVTGDRQMHEGGMW